MDSSKGQNILLSRPIYTSAQSGTSNHSNNSQKQNIIVYGNGTDIRNRAAQKGKAKRKIITQHLMLAIINVLEAKGETHRAKTYWNSYYCQSRLIQHQDRTFGEYCKNRHCLVCCANRKAKLVTAYLPIVEQWPDPHFMVLTARSVKANNLRERFGQVKKILRQIIDKYKKRFQRKKGPKLMGIYTIECNFNPIAKTYNPHLNIITQNRETAYTFWGEWYKRWNKGRTKVERLVSPKGQFIRRVDNNERALIEIIKYSAKVFTDPEMKKKGQRKLPPMIYAAAMDNIFHALRSFRIFDRFGFNAPHKEPSNTKVQLLTNYEELEFQPSQFDWLNEDTGELLAGFEASSQLRWLLEYNIDKELN